MPNTNQEGAIKLSLFLFILLQLPLFAESKDQSPKTQHWEFVYIDANTGQSSGGHTALKFGNDIYHFQYYPDKIFHLVREPWVEFRFAYNTIQNRSVEIQKIGISTIDHEFLKEKWNQKFLIQEKQLSILDELDSSEKQIQDWKQNPTSIHVPSFAYFQPSTTPKETWNELRHGIQSKLGSDFLISRKTELLKKIDAVPMVLKMPQTSFLSRETYPIGFWNSILELKKLHAQLAVLEVLLGNYELDKSYTTTDPQIQAFSESEKKALNLLCANWMQDFQTPDFWNRGDFGSLGLVRLARILAIQKSIEEDRPIFLDSFPDTAPKHNLEAQGEKWTEIQRKNLDTVFQYWRGVAFADEEIDEDSYRDLEESFNKRNEIYIPNSDGIRISMDRFYPKRSKPFPLQKQILELSTIEVEYGMQKRGFHSKLREIYPYHLILENCTTEIFRTIEDIYSQDPDKLKSALGGEVSKFKSGAFVPALASLAVESQFSIQEKVILPSYHQSQIQKEVSHQAQWQKRWEVQAKESNTITSDYYFTNPEDHWFCFFTAESVWSRPILGLANVACGLGQMTVGLGTVFWDRGENLSEGVNAIFFSSPELIFFNIRKGTFVYVSLEDLDKDYPRYTYPSESKIQTECTKCRQ